MNVYFLVEGECTELAVYPEWLKYLLPEHQLTDTATEATTQTKSYYLISGKGYPQLLGETLTGAIDTIREFPDCGYRYLVLCLDADDETVENRTKEVKEAYQEQEVKLPDMVSFRVIVQNRCIESWFLGNKKIFTPNPQNKTLRDYIQFYNVANNCPEEMGILEPFKVHAHFHEEYLKLLFKEKNPKGLNDLFYSKTTPRQVQEKHYLDQLILRSEDSALQTFGQFLALCREIHNLSSTTIP